MMKLSNIENKEVQNMEMIIWGIFGACTGWLAAHITGVRNRQSMLSDILVGTIGALIGGSAVSILGPASIYGLNPNSLTIALCGAIIVLMTHKSTLDQI